MNNTGKTLIILSSGFPKDEADSTCLPFPQLFVKKLKELNPSLNIIVLAFQYPFTSEEYMWHNVRVVPFNGKEKGKLNRLLVWLKVFRKLTLISKENKITGILNLWMGECALVGKYAAKKFNVKSFTWLMGQDAKKGNRYVTLTRPKPGNLIALSDFLAEEFHRNYRIMPLHIIPPAVDTAAFSATVHERNIDIIGVGSLIPLKQFDIFIRIIAKTVEKFPVVNAVICGEGPEKEKLSALIEKAGMQNNIRLVGEKDHKEILQLMQLSKILLHTSAYEGFATVYSEALYAGAHVVCFCKPMNNVFKHQHVVISEAAMVGEVENILADPVLDNSPVLAFSIEATCKSILSLYN